MDYLVSLKAFTHNNSIFLSHVYKLSGQININNSLSQCNKVYRRQKTFCLFGVTSLFVFAPPLPLGEGNIKTLCTNLYINPSCSLSPAFECHWMACFEFSPYRALLHRHQAIARQLLRFRRGRFVGVDQI